MKKLLLLIFTAISIFSITGCEIDSSIAFQNGIVVKTETNDAHGYKYRVKVKNIAKKGITSSYYVLFTDENYYIGDTIKIK